MTIGGLNQVVLGEGLSFDGGEHGRVIGLRPDAVMAMVLARQPILPNSKVAATGKLLTISAGDGLLGYTVNTLGHSLNHRHKKSNFPEKRVIEQEPLGVARRDSISRVLTTGLAIVDLLVPLGMGQRELVIGDRKTGKTHFLLQTMLTQARAGMICIYCAIGKRKVEVRSIEEFLLEHEIQNQCLIVTSDADTSAAEIFLSPYTAVTLAEYFRDQGRDTLLILDDLTTHAKYYREIALLSAQFPGRESYPGDIFHIQSRLLERTGCFLVRGKQATITCLPVCESVEGDLTGYIQTNLMSMTDGHLYFDSELFFQGKRPAINMFLSVTRVGKQTQTALFRDLGRKLTAFLKTYENTKGYMRFGAEISSDVERTIELGEAVSRFLDHSGVEPVPLPLQAVLMAMLFEELWEGYRLSAPLSRYEKSPDLQKAVQTVVLESKSFDQLRKTVSQRSDILKRLFL